MVALLDVNVLVALFDPMHAYHEAAHEWLADNRRRGWATCPLTENGLARILSNPRYPGRMTTVGDAVARLASFRQSGHHTFWPDSVSICDEAVQPAHVQGYRQLTDVYLLALAVMNSGRLATFDRGIPLSSVQGAGEDHLALLGADTDPSG